MEKCKYLGECSFYVDDMAQMPVEAAFLKDVFCRSKPENCARFKSALQAPVGDRGNQVSPLGFNNNVGEPHT